jgi:hypothetical protein
VIVVGSATDVAEGVGALGRVPAEGGGVGRSSSG